MKKGIIQSYIHNNGEIGVLMHISVEPDIGEKIKELLNHTSILAMQIAASKETSLSNLLKSKYIKNEELSVESYLYNLSQQFETSVNIERFTIYEA